ncbi:LCP family protein [Actinopolymorpha rutila]|uniref:LCP family protein required for cell wall assembly n=1 Tax=Actinopolymorpha rutila TaxID=446787 RepID=A0A852ZDD6_9ACTN|nr:LCP family protein required for cell wall assembly [Actinopolymorpha rutila]
MAGVAMVRLDRNVSTFDGRGIQTYRPPRAKANAAGETPVNVLVIGSDTRANGNSGLGGAGGAVGRSDTAIVVHVYADHRDAVAVSIPRDTLVDIPQCRLPDGSWSQPRRQTMFNAAFTEGLSVAGNPACTQNTVEKLTGLRIDHTIVVDFKGFASMTKAVGGVRVCVPNNVYAGDLNPNLGHRGKLVLAKGLQTVSGRSALDYVRVRHGIGDGSDIGRIQRQQAFLASLTAKIHASGMNPATLAPLADAATKALTVDPALGSAPKLVVFAMSLRHLNLHNIQFVTVPWRYAGDRVALVQPDADRLWSALKDDHPLAGHVNDNHRAASTAAVSGHGIDIGVYNGTRTPGLAAAATRQLRNMGFTIDHTGNARSHQHATTVIEYGASHQVAAHKLATLIPHAQLQPITGAGIDLVLGDDYRPIDTNTRNPAAAPKPSPTARPRTAADNPCTDLSMKR